MKKADIIEPKEGCCPAHVIWGRFSFKIYYFRGSNHNQFDHISGKNFL